MVAAARQARIELADHSRQNSDTFTHACWWRRCCSIELITPTCTWCTTR